MVAVVGIDLDQVVAVMLGPGILISGSPVYLEGLDPIQIGHRSSFRVVGTQSPNDSKFRAGPCGELQEIRR